MPVIENSGLVIAGGGLGKPFVIEGTPNKATFAGIAARGALLISTLHATLYINTGSQACPRWKAVITER